MQPSVVPILKTVPLLALGVSSVHTKNSLGSDGNRKIAGSSLGTVRSPVTFQWRLRWVYLIIRTAK